MAICLRLSQTGGGLLPVRSALSEHPAGRQAEVSCVPRRRSLPRLDASLPSRLPRNQLRVLPVPTPRQRPRRKTDRLSGALLTGRRLIWTVSRLARNQAGLETPPLCLSSSPASRRWNGERVRSISPPPSGAVPGRATAVCSGDEGSVCPTAAGPVRPHSGRRSPGTVADSASTAPLTPVALVIPCHPHVSRGEGTSTAPIRQHDADGTRSQASLTACQAPCRQICFC